MMNNAGILQRISLLLVTVALVSCMNSSDKSKDMVTDTEYRNGSTDESLNSNPALLALLEQADSYIKIKQWGLAQDKLERAIGINPLQSQAWSRLSFIALEKKEYKKAIRLAQRSNSHIKKNIQLKIVNWNIILNSSENLGDIDSTQKAVDEINILRLNQ